MVLVQTHHLLRNCNPVFAAIQAKSEIKLFLKHQGNLKKEASQKVRVNRKCLLIEVIRNEIC